MLFDSVVHPDLEISHDTTKDETVVFADVACAPVDHLTWIVQCWHESVFANGGQKGRYDVGNPPCKCQT